MPEYIKFDVRCIGCGKLIARPSEADMELFRLGINVHLDNDCIQMAEAQLTRRDDELRRMRREHSCPMCSGNSGTDVSRWLR